MHSGNAYNNAMHKIIRLANSNNYYYYYSYLNPYLIIINKVLLNIIFIK